jgi:hypothetical protein
MGHWCDPIRNPLYNISKSGTKTGGIILRILTIVMGLNAEKMPLWVEHKYYAECFTEA